MKLLAIITARGGSKRLPKKNVLNLNGKPLIAWTIEAALRCPLIDKTVLSSDDQEIIKIAKYYGCDVPFKCDRSLAEDNSSSVDVIIDALEKVPGYDWIVLLQPTSPRRSSLDIQNAIEFCLKMNANSCVSVTKVAHKPELFHHIGEGSKILKVSSKEELFRVNGAIYISKISEFLSQKSLITDDTVAYIMPPERSIDIDTKLDFEIASCSSIV